MKRNYILFIFFLVLTTFIFSGFSYSKGFGPMSNQNKTENFGVFLNDSNHGQQIKDINMQKNQEKQEIQNEFKNEIKNNAGSTEENSNEQNQIDQLKQEKKNINKEFTNELKANGKNKQ